MSAADNPSNVQQSLIKTLDTAWQHFWWQPSSLRTAAQLRVVAALFGFYYYAAWTVDLVQWLGSDGLWPRSLASVVASDFGQQTVFRFSLAQLSETPAFLYGLHILWLLNSLWLAWGGPVSRLPAVIHLLGILSYVHRGTVLTGPFEAVLATIALYVVIEPAGDVLLPDACCRHRPAPSRFTATIAWRLTQLHLAAVYLLGGLTMLANQTWWSGVAAWYLVAAPESRFFDLTFAFAFPSGIYLLNLLTHGVVAFHLWCTAFVWIGSLRAVVRPAIAGMWLLIALLSGQWSYAAIMAATSLVVWPARPADSEPQMRPSPNN